MSLDYIRKTYGVPARRGVLVEAYLCDGRLAARGRIWSGSHHLHLAGGPPLHPTSAIVYYGDDGEVLLDTREAARDAGA